MKYFIANWKAHKNTQSARDWMRIFSDLLREDSKVVEALTAGKISVIICPPHPLLSVVKESLPSYPGISIAAQDVSSFDEGDTTGEVASASLKGLAESVIIGHSSRRTTFGESAETLAKKCTMAKKNGLKVLFCVRGAADPIPDGVEFVAYEPVELIGTRNTQSLDDVLNVKKTLKLPPSAQFLYGAGVNGQSMGDLMASEEIVGLLIGSASLDPAEFFEILRAAC